MDEFKTRFKNELNILFHMSDVIFTNGCIYSCILTDGKNGLAYSACMMIFNVNYTINVCIENGGTEIHKLQIGICDKHIEKEIASCRNFLQRHRNLELTFAVLCTISKFLEARRLICDIVFQKEPQVSVVKDIDGGIVVQFLDKFSNIYLKCGWKIDWNMRDYRVTDAVEFYYNNFDVETRNNVRPHMENLTHSSLEFHSKLKLWRTVLKEIRGCSMKPIELDSDDECILILSDSEVNNNVHRIKRRKIDNNICSNVIHTVLD